MHLTRQITQIPKVCHFCGPPCMVCYVCIDLNCLKRFVPVVSLILQSVTALFVSSAALTVNSCWMAELKTNFTLEKSTF